MRALRWGDKDRYFGPFTWSYSNTYPHLAVILKSAGDGDGQCSLRISIGKGTLITALPNIIGPWREKVYPKSWDSETIKRLGRNWYWNVDPRKYGVSLSDGHLSVYYGRTGGAMADSSIEKRWSCFLPWTQWRHVRRSLYGLSGEHIWSEGDTYDWEAHQAAKAMCPTAKFLIEDSDGEQIIATTVIEEREWRLGAGWFKWLSWFRAAKISRSLRIEFAAEVGPEKGTWKGGVVGTSIEMLHGENHEAAFRRYCEGQHRSRGGRYTVKFVSAYPDPKAISRTSADDGSWA